MVISRICNTFVTRNLSKYKELVEMCEYGGILYLYVYNFGAYKVVFLRKELIPVWSVRN